MNQQVQLTLCFTAIIVMLTWLPVTSADMFTSSFKVEELVTGEDLVLTELLTYIADQYKRLQVCTNFYIQRLRDLNVGDKPKLASELNHPNAMYKAIWKFSGYNDVLDEPFTRFQSRLQKSTNQYLPDEIDVLGAIKALLRLQNVYDLKPADMARGDYLGFQGPKLGREDAYNIGWVAFLEDKFNQSLGWLRVSLATSADDLIQPRPKSETILAMIGRVNIRIGEPEYAELLYKFIELTEPNDHQVLMLWLELIYLPKPGFPKTPDESFHNFSRLCRLENRHHPADPSHSQIVCRYRPGYLPYYRFKEEILSIAPFASVIYNVITEEEDQHLKDLAKHELKRGGVTDGVYSSVTESRTSDVAWLSDDDSEIVESVSKRVEYIIGLDTTQRLPFGPSSSESFQVVNYGLGGHFDVHMDSFNRTSKSVSKELQESGDRIANVLIYLSDVQRGGATVFTHVGVSVAPVKNMALLWYNYDPAYNMDALTHHAACPVVIGQKWIANKWIWTYGNTFRRRCGLSPDSTQLDIEPDMMRGYQ